MSRRRKPRAKRKRAGTQGGRTKAQAAAYEVASRKAYVEKLRAR